MDQHEGGVLQPLQGGLDIGAERLQRAKEFGSDALIDPKETREILALALEVTLHRPRATALALETL